MQTVPTTWAKYVILRRPKSPSSDIVGSDLLDAAIIDGESLIAVVSHPHIHVLNLSLILA